MCASLHKFSDLLPETDLFFIWPKSHDNGSYSIAREKSHVIIPMIITIIIIIMAVIITNLIKMTLWFPI